MEAESLGGLEEASEYSLGQHAKRKERKHSYTNMQGLPNSRRTMSHHIVLFSVVAIGISLLLPLVAGQSPPPNYNYNKLPETSFTCADKATGGYYADPEAGCQMFHVCLRVSEEEINDFKFLCPNNTVFDQQNFICTNWWEINCERSTRYYSKNDLFKVEETTTTAPPETEPPNDPGYWEYVYEYIDPAVPAANLTKPEVQHRLQVNAKTDRKSLVDAPFVLSAKRQTAAAPITTTSRTPTTTRSTTRITTTSPEITTYRNTQQYPLYAKIKLGKPAFETRPEQQPAPSPKKSANTRRRSKSFVTTTDVPNGNITTTLKPITVPATQDRSRWRSRRRQKPSRVRNPDDKHKEFSNFRFYKTAFGRSYSSDDYQVTTPPTTQRSVTQRSRYIRPGRTRTRLGRTASRSTRYSKYAR